MRALRHCFVIALLILTAQLTTAGARGNQYHWGRKHELSWGRGSTKVIHPSDIAWSHYFSADYGVEADSNGTPAGDGDIVFFWNDQSGNNYNAYQGTNTNRPIFQTGVNGGNNGLLFDSNDDFLTVPGNDSAGEFTYYAVFSTSESSVSVRTTLFGHEDDYLYTGAFYFNRTDTDTWLNMSSAGTNTSNFGNLNQGTPPDKVHVIGIYIAGTTGVNRGNDKVYFDGVAKPRTGGDASGDARAWVNLLFGRADVWYGGFTLSEFGVYEGKLPEADRINLQNYWIKKYGVE